MPARTYEWVDANAAQDFLSQMSGLEYCRRVSSKQYPEAPIFKTLGIEFESVDHGQAVLCIQPHDYLMHGRGILHGGAISTLLDTAMAWAALSVLDEGRGCTTTHLSVDFVRPAPAGSGQIRAEGRVINAGRRVLLLEAKATNSAGKLVAMGSSTCLVSEIER
jgi:uncharacterized protein (TIGR00369 family)